MLAWLRAAGGRLRPVGWHPLSLAHASGEGEALALLHLPPAPTKGGRLEVDALPSPQGLVTARGSRADPLGISSSAHKGLTCVFISLDEVPAAVALGLEPAALPGEATVAVLKEPRATSAQAAPETACEAVAAAAAKTTAALRESPSTRAAADGPPRQRPIRPPAPPLAAAR